MSYGSEDRGIEKPISKRELRAFYQEVGRTIAEWLGSLECPDCLEKSDLDWLLKRFSDGQPQLLCRCCGRRFKIRGLKFKRVIVEPYRGEVARNNYPALLLKGDKE